MTTRDEVLELGRRWVAAELAGDADALDRLGAKDFRLVGPVGFVLDRQQWLDRYRGQRDLRLTDLRWDDVEVRELTDDVAVAIGVQTQQGTFAGNPVDARLRVTQIAVREDGEWRLAGLHFSPIGGPPPFGRPPGPASGR